MRVFVMSPANCATGGPELLHQFARNLLDNGIETYMLYLNRDSVNCPVPEVYWGYDVPYVTRFVDKIDSVLVLPETAIHHIHMCRKGIPMIWWLSVNNYIGSYKEHMKGGNYDVFHLKDRKNVVHFVQSFYAKDFLAKCMGINEAYFLKDYINDEIVKFAALCRGRYERRNVCLFNPKKGYEKLAPVINACRKDIQWVPLIGYKPSEMALLMCQAKLYVDFGSHPGKDRIPREAAVCGCCVLTNREGSAAYWDDVGICDQYKIESTQDVEGVLEKVYDLVDHYEERIGLYSGYRQTIEQEKKEFIQEVGSAIKILLERAEGAENTPIHPDDLMQHENILNSLGSVAASVMQILSDAKADCLQGGGEGVIDKLLTVDYMIQIIRESLYTELDALADLGMFDIEREEQRKSE